MRNHLPFFVIFTKRYKPKVFKVSEAYRKRVRDKGAEIKDIPKPCMLYIKTTAMWMQFMWLPPDGKEKIYAELLAENKGHYYQYIEEYGLEPAGIDFNHRNVHVISDEHGIEIADITAETDNEQFLKKCLELTFHFTKDPEPAVLFSVAGGRKTMSPWQPKYTSGHRIAFIMYWSPRSLKGAATFSIRLKSYGLLSLETIRDNSFTRIPATPG